MTLFKQAKAINNSKHISKAINKAIDGLREHE
jgi:hypothetical protein